MVSIREALKVIVSKLNSLYHEILSIKDRLSSLESRSVVIDSSSGIDVSTPLLVSDSSVIPLIVGVFTGLSLDSALNPLGQLVISHCDIVHDKGSLYIFLCPSRVINGCSKNRSNFHKLSLYEGNYYLGKTPIRIVLDIHYTFSITPTKLDDNSIFIGGEYYNITTTKLDKSFGFVEHFPSIKSSSISPITTNFDTLEIDDVCSFLNLPSSLQSKSGLTDYLVIYPSTTLSFVGSINKYYGSSIKVSGNIVASPSYSLISFSSLSSLSIQSGKVDGSRLSFTLDYVEDLPFNSWSSFSPTLIKTSYNDYTVHSLSFSGYDLDLTPDQLLVYLFDYSHYYDHLSVVGKNVIADFFHKGITYKVDITYHKLYLDKLVSYIVSYSSDKNNDLTRKVISLWKQFY